MYSHLFLVIWKESWFYKANDNKISITMTDSVTWMDSQLGDLHNNKYPLQRVWTNLISKPLQLPL